MVCSNCVAYSKWTHDREAKLQSMAHNLEIALRDNELLKKCCMTFNDFSRILFLISPQIWDKCNRRTLRYMATDQDYDSNEEGAPNASSSSSQQ